MRKLYLLKDLLTIKNGTDYREEKSGNIPVYGSGGIMTYIENYLYNGESILLPRKGTLNNIMYVNGKFWTVDTMYWSIVNKNIANTYFLSNYLKCLNLEGIQTGSTLPSMTNTAYYGIPVLLPDLKEQNVIAKVLFSIDDKIALNNKINAELEQIAKTLYNYWFVQFEFPGGNGGAYKSSNGQMVYNEILKREIPVGWEVKNIKELAEIVWGQCPDGKNILPLDSQEKDTLPYCSGAGDMQNSWGVSCQALTNNSKRKVDKGAILVSVAGTIGKITISNQTISLGRATLGIIPHNPLYLSFLIWFLKSYTNRLQQISVGAVQKIINNASLEEMSFPFSKDLINQYKYLNDITNLLMQKEEENIYLSNLKDFLLPMLMNGQVSVVQP